MIDRDGVINEDSHEFIKTVAEWRAIPGSLEAIAAFTRAGWRVAVVTNQSGVGRGLYDERALAAIQREKLTAADVARIDGEVDALRLHFTSLRSIKTEYGRFRFMLRGIDARWRWLAQRLGRELRNTDPEKEKLLQEFAHHFFGGLASYDPIPGKP